MVATRKAARVRAVADELDRLSRADAAASSELLLRAANAASDELVQLPHVASDELARLSRTDVASRLAPSPVK